MLAYPDPPQGRARGKLTLVGKARSRGISEHQHSLRDYGRCALSRYVSGCSGGMLFAAPYLCLGKCQRGLGWSGRRLSRCCFDGCRDVLVCSCMIQG